MKRFFVKHPYVTTFGSLFALEAIIIDILGIEGLTNCEPGVIVMYILGAAFLGSCFGNLYAYLRKLEEKYD